MRPAKLSIIVSRKLRLKSLDLLHAPLAKMIEAGRFIAFDEDIRRKVSYRNRGDK